MEGAMTRFRAWPSGARNGFDNPKIHGRRVVDDEALADFLLALAIPWVIPMFSGQYKISG